MRSENATPRATVSDTDLPLMGPGLIGPDQDRLDRVLPASGIVLEAVVAADSRKRFYRASMENRSRYAAVKITPLGRADKDATRDGSYRDRISRLRQVDHPNVMRLEQVGIDVTTDTMVTVLEWIRGVPIDRYVEEYDEQLNLGQFLGLLRSVAQGIDALHSSDLLHRDIKPGNVMVAIPSGVPKIGDYGVTISAKEYLSEGTRTVSTGTPAFVSPEQIIGLNVGPRSDVYSFAMTIYFLCARALAFDCMTCRELLFAHVNDPPIPLRARNRAWPLEMQEALMPGLAKDPESRPASATELVRRLAEALSGYTPLRLASFFDGSFTRFDSGEFPIRL